MRYFVHLAYKGTKFRGWQRQANTTENIQEVIEQCLLKMTKQKINFIGCGRTDAGVHAMQYFGHFDYHEEWTYDPIERLNRMLPKDIRMYELIPVGEKNHTRFDAKKRTYKYYIHLEEDPFLTKLSTFHRAEKIDFDTMNLAVQSLMEVSDFKYLCLTPDKMPNTLCTIYESTMELSANQKRIVFTFAANRFLKSMIRLIVARLLAVGEGDISLDEFKDNTKNNQCYDFRTVAHPQGLYLTKVEYPFLTRETKTKFIGW
jgi:tRNA pseudouridine38-40 synthase